MKRIITAGLLAFVGISCIYLFIGERRGGSNAGPPPATESKAGSRIVAYYFHTTGRCMTCYKIENYTRSSITENFAGALGSGRLVMKSVNVQEPGNEHYVRDYQLSTKSVVLVEMKDGAEKRWKNLERVWDEVGDEASFKKYIATELKQFGGTSLGRES